MSQHKKILILGAGGPAGILLTRCLKGYFDVYGKDDGQFAKHLMLAKPYSDEIKYDLIIPVPDVLVLKSASNGNHKSCFLPTLAEIQLCQDKAECAKVLGDLSPKTYWVRDTHGAGGKGAQMCSEYLPGRNLGTELLYKDGALKAYFQKERVSYSAREISPEVIGRGSAMVATCIQDNKLLATAMSAVQKITNNPNGVYAIDIKENEAGEAKITEINAGRFVTSSHVFYYMTGYNLPRMMVELALNQEVTPLGKYPEGQTVVRQMDREPCLIRL
jgi:hypothetical protein